MKQKGLTSILIVILIAVGLGGYLIYQKQTRPTPAPQPTTQPSPSPSDEAVSWKTYTNTEYGYAIKYPPVWSYIACGPATRFDTEPWYSCATDAQGIFSISVFDKTPETPLISISTAKEFKVISKNLVSIGGKQGERVVVEKVEPAPGADKIMVAAVEYKGKIFIFNLQDITQEETFNQTLSTFRFN